LQGLPIQASESKEQTKERKRTLTIVDQPDNVHPFKDIQLGVRRGNSRPKSDAVCEGFAETTALTTAAE